MSSELSSKLPSGLAARLLLPGSAEYEVARRPWDRRRLDHRPAAIAHCRDSQEVSVTVRWAARRGLRITPRSGGHSFDGRSSSGDVVVDVSEMAGIAVSDRRVEVAGGVRLGPLYRFLATRGLTLPGGCGPSVGVAGLTLGGGLGLLGRRYGLTCDRLVGAEVVTAGGEVIFCDEDRHSELFWALRGAGGGHLGVVTRLVFDPVPEPEVTVYRLGWSAESASDLVAAWTGWAPDADDRLSAHLEVSVPGDLHRPPSVQLVGLMIADEDLTRTVSSELASLAGAVPVSASYRPLRFADAKQLLGEDLPEAERPLTFHRSDFFDAEPSAAALQALIEHLLGARSAGQTRTVSLLPPGGAYRRTPDAETAFAHRRYRFLIEHIAATPPTASAADQQAAADWSTRSRALVHPEAAGGVYPNFPDAELDDWASAYWGDHAPRLREIKRRYDPENLFWVQQGLLAPDLTTS